MMQDIFHAKLMLMDKFFNFYYIYQGFDISSKLCFKFGSYPLTS